MSLNSRGMPGIKRRGVSLRGGIADHLIAADEIVFHIMGTDRVERAEKTEGAKREPDGILTYPGLL
jgi:hypothetical protein